MTELLCIKCDHEIFENIDKLNKYLSTFKKENDNAINKKIVINNINLCDVINILNYHIEVHNKKFNIYFVKCSFDISFDDGIYEIETTFVHNNEFYKLNMQLLFFIDMMKSEGKIFNKINQMIINIHSDKCNMTDEYSQYMPYSSIERMINKISGKYPSILKNNILIRNKSHIIFNI